MFSQDDDESLLFKGVKSIMYAFMVGAIYYGGGYGWALLFTRDEEKREKVAKYNLLALVFEILAFLTMFFIDVFSDTPVFGPAIEAEFIKFMLLHGAISFVGSIFYLVWWIISLFL